MIQYLTPSGHVVLLDDDVAVPGSLSIGSHGYAQFWNGTTVALLHRWLLGLEIDDKRLGDHVNRNQLDCRRSNLRIVTPAESNLNRSVSDNPRLAYPTRSGRWQAKVKRQGQSKHLGTFDTEEAARQAAQDWLQAA